MTQRRNHNAEEAMLAYMEAGCLYDQPGTPLFHTLVFDRKRNLTENRLYRQDAWAIMKRRARNAGLGDRLNNHTMRATGITAYMMAGGTLERALQMAVHASSRTTRLSEAASRWIHSSPLSQHLGFGNRR